jgi:cell wall-associated NlpC family hydrolase
LVYRKKLFFLISIVLIWISHLHFAYAENNVFAITQPIPMANLRDYSHYPPLVQKIISEAFLLSQMNLTYLYGSANPKDKGMDCSGTIYYLLSKMTTKEIPRSANEMFNWAQKQGKIYIITAQRFDPAEFSHLKPGDLLFWSGTYTTQHGVSISHVMFYLGKDKNNQPLMFGSSDGRTYQGKKMRGVSVFDFKLPNKDSLAKFVGYSCIPNLTCN